MVPALMFGTASLRLQQQTTELFDLSTRASQHVLEKIQTFKAKPFAI